jgi:hypothetical protein
MESRQGIENPAGVTGIIRLFQAASSFSALYRGAERKVPV